MPDSSTSTSWQAVRPAHHSNNNHTFTPLLQIGRAERRIGSVLYRLRPLWYICTVVGSKARICKRLWSPGILPGWESIPGLLKKPANTGSPVKQERNGARAEIVHIPDVWLEDSYSPNLFSIRSVSNSALPTRPSQILYWEKGPNHVTVGPSLVKRRAESFRLSRFDPIWKLIWTLNQAEKTD